MADRRGEWGDIVVHLLALASRLEVEGQYNIAKLLRAAADAMARRAAYISLTSEGAQLSSSVEQAISSLSKLGIDAGLIAALKRGETAMTEGRLPLIHEIPHPYVCRTCGDVVVGELPNRCVTCGAWGATFQRFLPVYWLDDLEPFAALERLRQTPGEVASLLDGLSQDTLTQEPAGGGWSIRQVVSHLRDAQGVLSTRLDLILEDDDPLLTSQAVFQWAARDETRPPTIQEVLDTYRVSRQETLAKLESIPLEDWWRTGRHEEFGTVTLRQQVSYFAAHESTHLPQLESLRHEFVER